MEAVHVEYYNRVNTSDTAVLFIHGIQGSPLQFDYMIEALEGTYCVGNLLLPGHGGTAKAFNRSSMVQWQNYVDEKVEKARRECRNLFLVGHSMGCLLSVQTAISNPDKIRGLFLTAMPLVIHITYPYVKNSMIVAFQKDTPKENEVIAAARRGKSITASSPLEYLGGVPRLAELMMKSIAVRGRIALLQMPVMVVHAEHDEVVSKKSLRYVEGMPNVRILTAEKSGHYFYSQAAKDRMLNELSRFVRQETGKEPCR